VALSVEGTCVLADDLQNNQFAKNPPDFVMSSRVFLAGFQNPDIATS
jgi:hypothetical protein